MDTRRLIALAAVATLALGGCQGQSKSQDMGLDPAPTTAPAPATSTTPRPTTPLGSTPAGKASTPVGKATTPVGRADPSNGSAQPSATGPAPRIEKSGAATVVVANGVAVTVPAGYEAMPAEDWAIIKLESRKAYLYVTENESRGTLADEAIDDAAAWTDEYGGTSEPLTTVPKIAGAETVGYEAKLDDGYSIVTYLFQRGGKTYAVHLDVDSDGVATHRVELDAVAGSLTFR